MEYLENGDLERYITLDLNEEDARSITRQLLEALKVMHGMNWVHRDLKPQNIFVVEAGPNWWVKIGDFGISRRLHYDPRGTHTMIGTPDYLAPEVSMPDAFGLDDSDDDDGEPSLRPTTAVDMWSLGCVLYRLFVKQLPFSSQKALKSYCKGKAQIPLEPVIRRQIRQEGIDILQGLLKPQPEARWTVAGALNHTWFDTQESGDGSITLATDEASSKDPPNALPEICARTAVNSMMGDTKSKDSSHPITESNPLSTPQILLEQKKARDWKHTNGEGLRSIQHSLVNKWSPVDEECHFDIPAASLSPSPLPVATPNKDLDAGYRSSNTISFPSLPLPATHDSTQAKTAAQIIISNGYQRPPLPGNSQTVSIEQPLQEEHALKQQPAVKLLIRKTNLETPTTDLSLKKPDYKREKIKPKRNLDQNKSVDSKCLCEQKYDGSLRERRLQWWKLQPSAPPLSALAQEQQLVVPRIPITTYRPCDVLPSNFNLGDNSFLHAARVDLITRSNETLAYAEPILRLRSNKVNSAHVQRDTPSQQLLDSGSTGPQQRLGSDNNVLVEALRYVEQVEAMCTYQPHIFGEFLQTLSDLKSQKINIPIFISRASQLFKDYPDLIHGFTKFLPPGYEFDRDGAITPRNGFNEASSFLDDLKVQCADKSDVYEKFLHVMAEFKRQVIDTSETVFEASWLLKDHPKLIQRFNMFLPLGYRVDYFGSNKLYVVTPNGLTEIKDYYADIKGAKDKRRLHQPAMGEPIKAML